MSPATAVATSREAVLAGRRSSWRSACLGMVAVAFVLRVGLMLWLTPYTFPQETLPFAPPHFHFGFGMVRFAETGAIARSIAEGHGFSSPFGGLTGPTAWIAPVYPYMLALLFKIFGVFTSTSAIAILTLNSFFSALTCIPIYLIAERTVGRSVGEAAGWIWAGGIYFMRWPITWAWDMALSALLLSLLVFFSIELGESRSLRKWAVFGLLWGFAALTNPSLLSVLPFTLAWPAWRLHTKTQRCTAAPSPKIARHSVTLRPLVVALVAFVLMVTPWLMRNRLVFGKFVFIRGNLPFEFNMGTYQGRNAMGWFGRAPTQNKWRYAHYQQIGEMQFVADAKQEAIHFLRHDRGEFLRLTAKRFFDFWDGNSLNYQPFEPWHPWEYLTLSVLGILGAARALDARVKGALVLVTTLAIYPG